MNSKNCLRYIYMCIFILICSVNGVLASELEFENDTLILDNSQLINIDGQVITPAGTPISGAKVHLLGAEVDEKRETGSDGNYAFSDMSPEGTYTMVADLNRAFDEGLDVADLILLEAMLAGTEDVSQLELLAADVNGSGEVTRLDAQILKSILLGEIDDYTNNSSWKFIVEGQSGSIVPAENILNGSQKSISYNIQGVKVGDMNASINRILKNEQNSIDNYTTLITSDKEFVIGEEVHVGISPSEDIELRGMQFSVAYDPEVLHFNSILPLEMEISEEDYRVDISNEGVIHIIFHNSEKENYKALLPLFEIVFTSNDDGHVKKSLHLSNASFISKSYNDDLQASAIEWRIEEDARQEIVFQNNAPNPFTNFTTIEFSLPEEMEVVIEIANANGSVIYSQTQTFSKGENFIELRDELGDQYGMLFVTIETAEFSDVKRMMRIR